MSFPTHSPSEHKNNIQQRIKIAATSKKPQRMNNLMKGPVPHPNPHTDNAEWEHGRGKDALILDNWADAMTEEAVAASPVGVARTEVEAVGAN